MYTIWNMILDLSRAFRSWVVGKAQDRQIEGCITKQYKQDIGGLKSFKIQPLQLQVPGLTSRSF